MPLNITSFNNSVPQKDQNALFKALGHPLVAEKVRLLFKELKKAGEIAVYDPFGYAAIFDVFYSVAALQVSDFYVQKIEDSEKTLWGKKVSLVSDLKNIKAKNLLIATFDTGQALNQIKPFLPDGIKIYSFNDLRLPEHMLSNPKDYLSPLNFATNFGFFRDSGGTHTRISIVNYWTKYGAKEPSIWLRLFDKDGRVLATWEERLKTPSGMYHFDSSEIRERFDLPEFTGSLFIHAYNIAGHDIIKYIVDSYGDDRNVLSCTHDANSWPADFYAGLPILSPEDKATIWVQNSHPIPIPAGALKLKAMGEDAAYEYKEKIPAFATTALLVNNIIPAKNHPYQVELDAGKYIVRPRYEVRSANGHSYIAHLNVERTDLQYDPAIAKNASRLGKGYILPMPILPAKEFESIIIPTPMSTAQKELPLQLEVYDAGGEKIMAKKLGILNRNETLALNIAEHLKQAGKTLPSGYGHIELSYDFDKSVAADGWLHAVGHYRQEGGHRAETSFGSHIYNMLETFKDEPQSYNGKPPGLTTRLYLRLGRAEQQFCHLIYPVSKEWHKFSDTDLILYSGSGEELEIVKIKIPMSGSKFWYYDEVFSRDSVQKAGEKGYIIVRDATCRLFGYHGLKNNQAAFALDHMFGC